MKLVSLCCFLILLLCCAPTPAGPPNLPTGATFGWKLKGIEPTKPELAPESVRLLGFRQSWRAEYTGPGTAQVDIYSLKSPAAGLEMTQRWRAAAQTVTLFNAKYFLVVAWQGCDRAAATALVGRIEQSLPRSD